MTYSVKFDGTDGDKYAVDWDLNEQGAWTVTSRPYYSTGGKWHESIFDEEAREALVKHFGVPQITGLPLDHVKQMSPAMLARLGGTNPTSDNQGPILHAVDYN